MLFKQLGHILDQQSQLFNLTNLLVSGYSSSVYLGSKGHLKIAICIVQCPLKEAAYKATVHLTLYAASTKSTNFWLLFVAFWRMKIDFGGWGKTWLKPPKNIKPIVASLETRFSSGQNFPKMNSGNNHQRPDLRLDDMRCVYWGDY